MIELPILWSALAQMVWLCCYFMENTCAHGVIVLLVYGVHLRTWCDCVARLRSAFHT